MDWKFGMMAEDSTTPEQTQAPAGAAPEPVEIESPMAVEPDPREAEIALLKEETAQYKDRLLRTAADMDNLRKRAEREKAEATL